MKTEKDLDDMNTNLVRTLKNSDNDKGVLSREIFRMQHIDRLKVAHAKDSFYNPDIGSMLPSLDTAHASGSVNEYMTQSQSLNVTPLRGLGESPGGKDYFSMISQNDIITKNEIKGICERNGVPPSQRQRIIIARSQDPVNTQNFGAGNSKQFLSGAETDRLNETNRQNIGSLDNQAFEAMNKTHHFKNDSKMSIQAGALKEHSTMGSNLINRNTVLRPFDAFGKLAINHKTIQP